MFSPIIVHRNWSVVIINGVFVIHLRLKMNLDEALTVLTWDLVNNYRNWSCLIIRHAKQKTNPKWQIFCITKCDFYIHWKAAQNLSYKFLLYFAWILNLYQFHISNFFVIRVRFEDKSSLNLPDTIPLFSTRPFILAAY